MKKWIFLLLPLSLLSYEGDISTRELIQPWFTGTLLATSGLVVPAGHFNTEPYIFAISRTSFYNNDWKSVSIDPLWNVQFRTPFWVGVAPWADLRITPVWNWNHRENQSEWTLGDWVLQLSFQLYKETLPSKNWYPSVKVCIRETFPTGKYQNLNVDKLGTDGGGMGTYATAVSINFSKLFHFYDVSFLNLRFNVVYSVPTEVHVKGLNAYGGGMGTDGIVTPEKSFLSVFGFEYSLARNWAIACDFQGIWCSQTYFKGNPGKVPYSDSDIDPSGVPAVNENKASIQYSIAPAIEYNWSAELGLIAGVWLTLAGKNSSHFTTGVIALNYFH